MGRQEAIAEVDELLLANRVVTLTGPGGAGKTRLALAVAHDQGAVRPVWLVELAQVQNPADVASEVASAIGLTSLNDPVEALAARLADHPGLLVLDTCEHIIDACAGADGQCVASLPWCRNPGDEPAVPRHRRGGGVDGATARRPGTR